MQGPSRTAFFTALIRGHHTRTTGKRILVDPWSDLHVRDAVRLGMAQNVMQHVPAGQRAAAQAAPNLVVDAWLRNSPAYANVIVRSRYTEDSLHDAVARGVRQYVLVGAGLDSYAFRSPLTRQQLRVFEVDHPDSQGYKRARINELGIESPAALRFIAANLAEEPLDKALVRSDFDVGAPAFFSWLGVTMYLTREANLDCLRAMARCAAPGSEVVFTYIEQEAFDLDPASPTNGFAAMQNVVSAVGEPFLCGFDPAKLGADLVQVGFELVEDMTDAQMLRRYDPAGTSAMPVGGFGRIARARVAQRTQA